MPRRAPVATPARGVFAACRLYGGCETSGGSSGPRLGEMGGEDVAAKVGARTAQHRVGVVGVVGGVVVLDEQVACLEPVVVAVAGLGGPLPGEVQFGWLE